MVLETISLTDRPSWVSNNGLRVTSRTDKSIDLEWQNNLSVNCKPALVIYILKKLINSKAAQHDYFAILVGTQRWLTWERPSTLCK